MIIEKKRPSSINESLATDEKVESGIKEVAGVGEAEVLKSLEKMESNLEETKAELAKHADPVIEDTAAEHKDEVFGELKEGIEEDTEELSEEEIKYSMSLLSKILSWIGEHDDEFIEDCLENACGLSVEEIHDLDFTEYKNHEDESEADEESEEETVEVETHEEEKIDECNITEEENKCPECGEAECKCEKEQLDESSAVYGIFGCKIDPETGKPVEGAEEIRVEVGSKEEMEEKAPKYEANWNVNSNGDVYKFEVRFIGNTTFESLDCANRKELSEAIQECKDKDIKFTVKRSMKEGFRYELTKEILTEGNNAEGELIDELVTKGECEDVEEAKEFIENGEHEVIEDDGVKAEETEVKEEVVEENLTEAKGGLYQKLMDTLNSIANEEPDIQEENLQEAVIVDHTVEAQVEEEPTEEVKEETESESKAEEIKAEETTEEELPEVEFTPEEVKEVAADVAAEIAPEVEEEVKEEVVEEKVEAAVEEKVAEECPECEETKEEQSDAEATAEVIEEIPAEEIEAKEEVVEESLVEEKEEEVAEEEVKEENPDDSEVEYFDAFTSLDDVAEVEEPEAVSDKYDAGDFDYEDMIDSISFTTESEDNPIEENKVFNFDIYKTTDGKFVAFGNEAPFGPADDVESLKEVIRDFMKESEFEVKEEAQTFELVPEVDEFTFEDETDLKLPEEELPISYEEPVEEEEIEVEEESEDEESEKEVEHESLEESIDFFDEAEPTFDNSDLPSDDESDLAL